MQSNLPQNTFGLQEKNLILYVSPRFLIDMIRRSRLQAEMNRKGGLRIQLDNPTIAMDCVVTQVKHPQSRVRRFALKHFGKPSLFMKG
mmetsp:Transcript_14355/g.24682  ORF Transcript_14355/g.24682 Transcript_14355/m.24682 type:complete len:88 (+) Transcript_14355:564-827(+)